MQRRYLLIWQSLRKLFYSWQRGFAWLMERRIELFCQFRFIFKICILSTILPFWIAVSLHSVVLRYYLAFGNQFLWKLTLTRNKKRSWQENCTCLDFFPSHRNIKVSFFSKRRFCLSVQDIFPIAFEVMKSHPFYFEYLQKINKTSIFNFNSPDKLFYTSKPLCKSRNCYHLTVVIWHSVSWNVQHPVMYMSWFSLIYGLENVSLNNLSTEGECHSLLFPPKKFIIQKHKQFRKIDMHGYWVFTWH